MAIVHALVSLTPVPGSYNVVKSATLEVVSIDAVTVPVVSAAIDLALAILIAPPVTEIF